MEEIKDSSIQEVDIPLLTVIGSFFSIHEFMPQRTNEIKYAKNGSTLREFQQLF